MIATISVKGQTVIPEAIREQARIKSGDKLDVGYANGLIVMRKRKALTPARVRSLILAGRELPEMTPADETAVARAIARVRSRRKPMKVVFDTNVVASASFWRGKPFDCLTAWAQGQCEAVVSPAMLAEYHETIEELSLGYADRAGRMGGRADRIAALVFPTDRATGATPDPDDEMILECALAAEADYIVTGDKKHLLPLREFRGIRIVCPADFLRRL